MAKSRSIAASLIGVAVAAVTISQVINPARAEVPQNTVEVATPAEIELTDRVITEAPQAKSDSVAPATLEIEAIVQSAPEPLAPMPIVAEAADGYIVFVEDASHVVEGATDWPQAKLDALVSFYEEAIAAYIGETGFGSTERWAEAFGISKDNPLRVVYAGNKADPAPARAGWREGTAVITHYTLRTSISTTCIQLVIHEMAHIWDGANDWALGEDLIETVENPEGFPTAKARDEGPKEDFAESVTALLWPGYAVNALWSDDTSDAPDATWTMDRHDFVEALMGQGS